MNIKHLTTIITKQLTVVNTTVNHVVLSYGTHNPIHMPAGLMYMHPIALRSNLKITTVDYESVQVHFAPTKNDSVRSKVFSSDGSLYLANNHDNTLIISQLLTGGQRFSGHEHHCVGRRVKISIEDIPIDAQTLDNLKKLNMINKQDGRDNQVSLFPEQVISMTNKNNVLTLLDKPGDNIGLLLSAAIRKVTFNIPAFNVYANPDNTLLALQDTIANTNVNV
ncbi:MAG: hypothetical protein V3V61_00985 [Gammaproteobacteria bacterium]